MICEGLRILAERGLEVLYSPPDEASGCHERAGEKQEWVYGFVGGHEAWREPKEKAQQLGPWAGSRPGRGAAGLPGPCPV